MSVGPDDVPILCRRIADGNSSPRVDEPLYAVSHDQRTTQAISVMAQIRRSQVNVALE